MRPAVTGKVAFITLLPALLMSLAQPVQAQFLGAFDYFGRGNYCKARELWLDDWKRRDSSAALGLAETYARGLCVKEDQQRASLWYLRAAQSGSARARSELGLRFAYGRGVGQDYFKSYVWLQAARITASPWERSLLDAVQQNIAVVRSRLTSEQRVRAEAILADYAVDHVLPNELSGLD